MEEYDRLENIGGGSYGVVYKCMKRTSREIFAVKMMNMKSEDEGLPVATVREICILKELDHPNIVTLHEVLMDDQQLYLLFEFVSMDLHKFITSRQKKHLNSITTKSFTYQLLDAVFYCHVRRILHRDLKPQNILIDTKNDVLKIADFGLGCTVNGQNKSFTHEVVTLWYRAPEILLYSEYYSYPIDIWSIGCIIVEMASGIALFRGSSEIDQLFCIFKILSTPNEDVWPGITNLKYYKPTFPTWNDNILSSSVTNLSNDGLDLVQAMLAYDPDQRINAKNALRHRYFKNLSKSNLPALP